MAVIGRDPSCDVVLDDVKCSRRHAVVEMGPGGPSIRDAGSANGLFVNGERVERRALLPGDRVLIGGVTLLVLPEPTSGTLVMPAEALLALDAAQKKPALPETEDFNPKPPADAPRPPLRPAPLAALPPRSTTVALLAGLWLATAAAALAGALALLALARDVGLPTRAAGAALLLAIAAVSVVLAWGVWSRAGWGRALSVLAAICGLLLCPFTLASVAVLAYLMSAAGREQFEPGRPARATNDGLFAAAIGAAVLLGAAISAGGVALGLRPGGPWQQAHQAAHEQAAVAQLHRVASAERAYAAGTCPGAFADLQTLAHPGRSIPGYPANGPVFLPEAAAPAEAAGYRFSLTVSQPLGPGECRSNGYRHFLYRATPVDALGRHLVTGEDGLVHAAESRAATADDPLVP